MTRTQAKKVVDRVLEHVEASGRLEGRKGNKVVVFPLLFNYATGATRPYVDRIVDDVVALTEKRPKAKAKK